MIYFYDDKDPILPIVYQWLRNQSRGENFMFGFIDSNKKDIALIEIYNELDEHIGICF